MRLATGIGAAVFGLLAGIVLLAGCSAGETGGSSAASSKGRQLYMANCALCHGAEGQGKAALGASLVDNEFIQARSDEELVQFLIEGRRADHPLNTKGVDMPPRGGNPGLSDEDLLAIAVYTRSLD